MAVGELNKSLLRGGIIIRVSAESNGLMGGDGEVRGVAD